MVTLLVVWFFIVVHIIVSWTEPIWFLHFHSLIPSTNITHFVGWVPSFVQVHWHQVTWAQEDKCVFFLKTEQKQMHILYSLVELDCERLIMVVNFYFYMLSTFSSPAAHPKVLWFKVSQKEKWMWCFIQTHSSLARVLARQTLFVRLLLLTNSRLPVVNIIIIIVVIGLWSSSFLCRNVEPKGSTLQYLAPITSNIKCQCRWYRLVFKSFSLCWTTRYFVETFFYHLFI